MKNEGILMRKTYKEMINEESIGIQTCDNCRYQFDIDDRSCPQCGYPNEKAIV